MKFFNFFSIIKKNPDPKNPPHINGVYDGVMSLHDGFDRKIPFVLTLNSRNKYVYPGEALPKAAVAASGRDTVLSASCLIDGDGGPYRFSDVYYNIDKNTLRFWYVPNKIQTTEVSNSFALEGKLTPKEKDKANSSDTIAGKVYSESYGHIGEFTLTSGSKKSLPARSGYVGEWEGQAQLGQGKKETLAVRIMNGLTSTQNPSNWEFEFTPGKIASFHWGNAIIISNDVCIDYLRRNIICVTKSKNGSSVSNGPDIPFWISSFTMAADGSSIHGEISSALTGKVISFHIPRK